MNWAEFILSSLEDAESIGEWVRGRPEIGVEVGVMGVGVGVVVHMGREMWSRFTFTNFKQDKEQKGKDDIENSIVHIKEVCFAFLLKI